MTVRKSLLLTTQKAYFLKIPLIERDLARIRRPNVVYIMFFIGLAADAAWSSQRDPDDEERRQHANDDSRFATGQGREHSAARDSWRWRLDWSATYFPLTVALRIQQPFGERLFTQSQTKYRGQGYDRE